MGNFNEDMLYKPDPELVELMAHCGYSQSVHTPTTDLIDHVYCNSPASKCTDIHVFDVYYSDHDVILCFTQLNSAKVELYTCHACMHNHIMQHLCLLENFLLALATVVRLQCIQTQ